MKLFDLPAELRYKIVEAALVPADIYDEDNWDDLIIQTNNDILDLYIVMNLEIPREFYKFLRDRVLERMLSLNSCEECFGWMPLCRFKVCDMCEVAAELENVDI